MTQKRAATERQLEHAKQAVEAREAVLKENGGDTAKDTVLRNLNAKVRKIDGRLRAIAGIEQREKDLEERRNAPAEQASSDEE